MTAGVQSGRVVTAACVAAGQADAKVQPFLAVAQALLATLDLGGQLGHLDRVQVSAGLGIGAHDLRIAKSSSGRGVGRREGEPNPAVDADADPVAALWLW